MLAEGTVRADSGRDEFTGEGALIEAWAVLAETEDVGGPEEKIDRLGVLKREVWCMETLGAARSSSGAGAGSARWCGRGEKMVPTADVSTSLGEGEVLVEVGGKDQVGS